MIETLTQETVKNIAIIGNPNCGKTTLFNALTGLRQKVGNYPGVTVEKKEGKILLANGSELSILDLPGTYSLSANSNKKALLLISRSCLHSLELRLFPLSAANKAV